MLKHLMNATALASLVAVMGMVAVAIAPAHAGTNCTQKTDNINGKLGGNAFGFSADTRNFIGDDDNFARLQSEDCVSDDSAARDAFKDAKRDARRSAGVAAAMDAYGEQPGLNLTLNYANIGLEDDVNAAGAVLGYRHDFANPGVIHSITGKLGFAGDTTWDEQGVSAGVTFSFGTF